MGWWGVQGVVDKVRNICSKCPVVGAILEQIRQRHCPMAKSVAMHIAHVKDNTSQKERNLFEILCRPAVGLSHLCTKKVSRMRLK